MVEDQTIDQMYAELEKNKKERDKSLIKKMSPMSRWVVAIILGVLAYFMIIRKYDMTKGLIIFAIIIGILYFITKGGSSRELTEQEIKAMLYKQLRFKQLHPFGDYYEIAPGTIKISRATVKRWMEGIQGAWRWETGFSTDSTEGPEDFFSAEQDPYTGEIIAIIERPEGFTGKEAAHIKWLETPEERAQRRYYERTGVKGGR